VKALNGNHNYQIMRVIRYYKRETLHILLDSSSTHKFLDLAMAEQVRCLIKVTHSQPMWVADGNQLPCQHVIQEFHLVLQGIEFSYMFSCLLEAMTWWWEFNALSTVGTINWNFNQLHILFSYKGESHNSEASNPRVRLMQEQDLAKSLQDLA